MEHPSWNEVFVQVCVGLITRGMVLPGEQDDVIKRAGPMTDRIIEAMERRDPRTTFDRG